MPATRLNTDISTLLAEKTKNVANLKQTHNLLDALKAQFRREESVSGRKVCEIVAVIEKSRIKQPRRQSGSSSTGSRRGTGSSGTGRGKKTNRRTVDPCEAPNTLRKLLLCMNKCCVTAAASKSKPSRKKQVG